MMRSSLKIACATGICAVFLAAGSTGYVTIYPGHSLREATKQLRTPLRAAIADRNGAEMVKPQWLYSIAANSGRERSDAVRAAGLVMEIIGSFRVTDLQERLESKAPFAWVVRGLDKASADKILALGVKGFEVRLEPGRAYSDPLLAPHVFGALNVDGRGISGLERGIERELNSHRGPWVSSLDARLQHQTNEQLGKAVAATRAVAGAAVVLDVQSGEILALSSAPRFRSDRPLDALEKDNMNRATVGVDEARSIAHLVAAATLVEHGYESDSRLSVVDGYGWGGLFRRSGQEDTLHRLVTAMSGPSLAYAALQLGPDILPAKTKELGLHDAIPLETLESALPLLANRGNLGPRILAPSDQDRDGDATEDNDAVTAAAPSPFPIGSGEGIAASPLAWASTVAAIINCGRRVAPTLRKHDRNGPAARDVTVFSERTSHIIGDMLRNEARNIPHLAGLEPLDLGAKAGFDQKVINGRYVANRIKSSAVIAFPMRAPRYLAYVMLDEPTTEVDGKHLPDRSSAIRLAAAMIRDISPSLAAGDHGQRAACS